MSGADRSARKRKVIDYNKLDNEGLSPEPEEAPKKKRTVNRRKAPSANPPKPKPVYQDDVEQQEREQAEREAEELQQQQGEAEAGAADGSEAVPSDPEEDSGSDFEASSRGKSKKKKKPNKKALAAPVASKRAVKGKPPTDIRQTALPLTTPAYPGSDQYGRPVFNQQPMYLPESFANIPLSNYGHVQQHHQPSLTQYPGQVMYRPPMPHMSQVPQQMYQHQSAPYMGPMNGHSPLPQYGMHPQHGQPIRVSSPMALPPSLSPNQIARSMASQSPIPFATSTSPRPPVSVPSPAPTSSAGP